MQGKISKLSENDKKQCKEQANEVKENLDNPIARKGIVSLQEGIILDIFQSVSKNEASNINLKVKRNLMKEIVKKEMERISSLTLSRTKYYMEAKNEVGLFERNKNGQ